MIIYFTDAEPAEQDFFLESLPDHDLRSADSLADVAPDAEILCIFINDRVDAAFLAAHPRLRLIVTRSSTTEHIDLAACERCGVAVGHASDYGDVTVAEHTFALMLAVARRLREIFAIKGTGGFSYEATRGLELRGKTLGILGMGHIGQRVAALAQAFQMRVIAADVDAPPALAAALRFEWVSLEELFRQSDILSLHASLSAATYHIINADTLAQCRPGVLIINTARGALIDTAALRDALDRGHVGGAGLDVLQDERVLRDTPAHIIGADIVKHLRSDAQAHEARDADRVRELQELMLGDALLSRRNVIFTPHIAFNTADAVARMRERTLAHIVAATSSLPSE